MRAKYLIISILALGLLACRKSKLKTERTTQVNQTFFKEKLQSSISNCNIENDRFSFTSNIVFPNLSQASNANKNASHNDFQIDMGDTLFVKPTEKFKVYFIFNSTSPNSLLLTYESEFNYSTFSMRKKIIDTGDFELKCGE